MGCALETGSDWSQQFGAQCPACGTFTKLSYKQSPWLDNLKVRYHACPDEECGYKFKSVEADHAKFKGPGPPTLHQLRYVLG